jgi:hypothetical protein
MPPRFVSFIQGVSRGRTTFDLRYSRKRRGHSQEDMISFGFSARHWQQIEAGRPITMTTLLRICDVFKIRVEVVVRGLDRGIYHD